MGPKDVQLIMKDGVPEYAILPYAEYQALLKQARYGEGEQPLVSALVQPAAGGVSATHQRTPLAADIEQSFDPADLVRRRKEKKLGQSQLARQAKVGLMNLIQFETGQKEPSESVRADLARVLGVEKL